MKNLLISVIMPVFNGERHLKEAVDSILNQTFSDFEFIIIDDGSTDSTPVILRSFSDTRIKLITHPTNQGIVSSLNEGIIASKGRYIARMDSDDISVSNRLELQLQFLENNPDYGLCAGNIVTIDEQNKVISSPWWKHNNLPIAWSLVWNNVIPHPTVMLRASTIPALAYRESFLSEDYDLWLRMLKSSKIVRLDDVHIKYRLHPAKIGSPTSNRKSMDAAYRSNVAWINANLNLKVPKEHRYLSGFSQYGEDFGNLSINNVLTWLRLLTQKLLENGIIQTKDIQNITKSYENLIISASEKLTIKRKISLFTSALSERHYRIFIKLVTRTIWQYLKMFPSIWGVSKI